MEGIRLSVREMERTSGPLYKTHKWIVSIVIEEVVVYSGYHYTRELAWRSVPEVIEFIIKDYFKSQAQAPYKETGDE